MRLFIVAILIAVGTSLCLTGCDQPPMNSKAPAEPAEVQDDRVPPAPPLKETFDGTPTLSLFPRVGDYQPDAGSERHPFWRTFIDHFSKVSGLVEEKEMKNRAWSFRGIKTIDSVAFFSPIAVEPSTSYRIGYRTMAELPEGATTGIGILEFREFLWIGEQYTEKLIKENLVGSTIGIELSGRIDWEAKDFVLKTGPQTKMIHLVFYREGEHSRKPVLVDDIEIVKAVTSGE